MKIVIYSLLLISLLACKSKPNHIAGYLKQEEILPVKKITEISDTTFLSLVTDISDYNEFLYLVDFKNNRLVSLDSDCHLVRTYGGPGRGPGEFNFPGGIFVTEAAIYAVDDGNDRVNIFRKTGECAGQYSGTIPRNGRFVITDSLCYGSGGYELGQPPMFISNLKGDTIKRFGSHKRILQNININSGREFFLEKWENRVIAICQSDPVIEIYTLGGEKVNDFNLSQFRHFVRSAQYIEKK